MGTAYVDCGWRRAVGGTALGALVVLSVAGCGMTAAERALRHAPGNAFGLLHVECERVRDAVLDKLGEGKTAPAESLAALRWLASKIDHVDIFFVPKGDGSAGPLVVLHGSLSRPDVERFVSRLAEPAKLRSKGNGRYVVGEHGDAARFVFGDEANDVRRGVTLIAPQRILTDALIGSLGKRRNRTLVKLLKHADTSKPIWGACEAPPGEKDGPRFVAGWLEPRGEGAGEMKAVFASEQEAVKGKRELTEDVPKDIARLLRATRQGSTVTLTFTKPFEALREPIGMLLGALAGEAKPVRSKEEELR